MHITGLTELFEQNVVGVAFQKNSDSPLLTTPHRSPTPSTPVPRPQLHAMTADHLLIWGAEAQEPDSFNTNRLLEMLIEELGHEG